MRIEPSSYWKAPGSTSLGVTAVVLDQQRGENQRLWTGLLIATYTGLQLHWTPPLGALITDLAAAIGFALLIRENQPSMGETPPTAAAPRVTGRGARP